MTEAEIIHYVTATFADIAAIEADGNTFLYVGEERNIPFATLVTSDAYDAFSDLNRAGVFRFNMGVAPATARALVDEVGDPDFTALDRILPHPFYGKMGWLCVLNPSAATFEILKPHLHQAYEKARAKARAKATKN